jgi:hypothetical protein
LALVKAAKREQGAGEGGGEGGRKGGGEHVLYVVEKLLAAGRVGDAIRLCHEEAEIGEAVWKEGGREGGREGEAWTVTALGVLMAWQDQVRKAQAVGPCATVDPGRRLLEADVADVRAMGKEDVELESIQALCEAGRLEEAIERIGTEAALRGGKPRPSVVNMAMEYAVVVHRDVAGEGGREGGGEGGKGGRAGGQGGRAGRRAGGRAGGREGGNFESSISSFLTTSFPSNPSLPPSLPPSLFSSQPPRRF